MADAKKTLTSLLKLLKWVSIDPASRIYPALEEIQRKWDKVYAALREAIIPELRDYLDTVVASLGFATASSPSPAERSKEAGKVEESAAREKSGEAERGSRVLQEGGGEGGASGGESEVREVGGNGGRSDNDSVDVEGGVQASNDGDSVHGSGNSGKDAGKVRSR